MTKNSIVYQKQKVLVTSYLEAPEKAWITDSALIEGKNLQDPFHTSVTINEELKIDFPVGVHRALGGFHDAPNPGDLLCASLAACFESTLRLIANRLNIPLVSTKVFTTAEVDVRGTLMINKAVPTGFQKISVFLEVGVADQVKPDFVKTLIRATERSCVIFQTLNKGMPITVESRILNAHGQIV